MFKRSSSRAVDRDARYIVHTSDLVGVAELFFARGQQVQWRHVGVDGDGPANEPFLLILLEAAIKAETAPE